MRFLYTSLETGATISPHFVRVLGVCIYKIKQVHLLIYMTLFIVAKLSRLRLTVDHIFYVFILFLWPRNLTMCNKTEGFGLRLECS
jgi:hypothetical protein